MTEEPIPISSPPKDEQSGLPMAELLEHAIKELHDTIVLLIQAAGGSERLSIQFIAGKLTSIAKKYDQVLVEIARLDGEIIRAHERLDSAKAYLATLPKPKRKEANDAGAKQNTD